MGTVVNLEYNADLRCASRSFISRTSLELFTGPDCVWYSFSDPRGLKIVDGGDISPNLSLETAHDQLRQKVQQVIRTGGIPFVVGGGNDQSYANACGLIDGLGKYVGNPPHKHKFARPLTPAQEREVWCCQRRCAPRRSSLEGWQGALWISVPPAVDGRSVELSDASSSSWAYTHFFFLFIEARWVGKGNTFIEFAAQGNQCSAEHWEWVLKQPNSTIVPYSALRVRSSPYFCTVLAHLTFRDVAESEDLCGGKVGCHSGAARETYFCLFRH